MLFSGFIGKIRLQIPVRHLKSAPWVISIENLYLVAGPATKTSYNPENEDKHIQDRKVQQLAALEAQWKVGKVKLCQYLCVHIFGYKFRIQFVTC